MFKKVLVVVGLVAFLVFVSGPVYATGSYTFLQGKVYAVEIEGDVLDVTFSDNVLFGDYLTNEIGALNAYDTYGMSYVRPWYSSSRYLLVYNISDSDVIMTLNDGAIANVDGYDSPFSLVMFDGSGSAFEVRNLTDDYISYKLLNYNEDDGCITIGASLASIGRGASEYFEGKGVFLFKVARSDLENTLTFEGVYEVSDVVRYDFFVNPPWILRMDLAGIIRVFWEELSILLPVGLVVLSMWLLTRLVKYTMGLFL